MATATPTTSGYYWSVGYDGPSDATKQAYGHAFVLLAASSVKVAGHPDADRLITDISMIIRERFWEEQFGAVGEEFTRDWQSYDSYRGQNSNMHLTESLMAAFEATDDFRHTYVWWNESLILSLVATLPRTVGAGLMPAAQHSGPMAQRPGTR